MNNKYVSISLLRFFLLATGLPLVVIFFGGFQPRTLLKDSLSLLTTLSFCLLIGQFFWCRMNMKLFDSSQAGSLIKFHNVVGYTAVLILLTHPFFLVLPRFFEKGMGPWQAFVTIVTTSSSGIVLGLISWGIMAVLGLTSFFRKKLPIHYITWRRLHGLVASVFLITTTWHVVDLGRHCNFGASVLFIGYCTIALLLYINNNLTKTTKCSGKKEWLIQA